MEYNYVVSQLPQVDSHSLSCPVCHKSVSSHSCTLKCCVCELMYHLHCLPNVTKSDSIYINRDRNYWTCVNCNKDLFPFNHFDDDSDFQRVIAENTFFNLNNVLVGLENLVFDPFDINDLEDNWPLFDNDPDVHFYNEYLSKYKCNYVVEDSFNKLCSEHSVMSDHFSIFHLNIRSMTKNLHNLLDYLNNLDMKFAIICMSETWLNDNNRDLHSLNSYTHISQCRLNRIGGGVSIFLKDTIAHSRRIDLDVNNSHIESLFIEIPKELVSHKQNVIVGVIYRPPNTEVDVFNNHLTTILSTIKSENKIAYISGDFNINLLNVESHIQSSEFMEIMYSFSYLPLINKPTRVKETSATLIDNIFCNSFNDYSYIQGICVTDITDHFPIFCIALDNAILEKRTFEFRRQYNEKNIEKFCVNLESTDWTTVMSDTDCQSSYSKFHDIFLGLYDCCFPLRRVELKYRNRKPYLTEGLKKSIKVKNKLYKRSLKMKTLYSKKNYLEYKHKLCSLLRKLEREYYDTLFTQFKSNLKKSWSLIKGVINKKTTKCTQVKFNINGLLTSDGKEIVNAFNNYYTNIGSSLASHIPTSSKNPVDYITKNVVHSLFLRPVDNCEVQNIILALKDSSAGWDNISSKIMKRCNNLIILQLTHLFNLSLQQGVFPDQLKIAKVVPLFKGGDSMLISNYRPVSILPLFSKVLEKIVYSRVIEFVNQNEILYKYQFGFRENYRSY